MSTPATTDARDALAELFAGLEIASAEAFTLGGRTFPVHAPAPPEAPGAPPAAGPPLADGGPFVATLAAVLYRWVYSRAYHGRLPAEDDAPPSDATAPDPELLARLSAANATRERWEHGWTIRQIQPDGRIQAQRGTLRRLVWPGQFLSQDGPGAPPRPGARISLFYAQESTTLQRGFYYLFGETAEEESHGYGTMRFYWNVDPAGAPRLVGALATTLNRYQVPFRMKCAVAPAEYERTDVAVLYVPKRFTAFAFDLLPEIYPHLRDHLAPEVPFFSRRLAPGLSLAEDPGTGESFGQHRCRLVAEAAWACFLRQEHDVETRLAELRRRFAQGGVAPDHPHLNAGSLDPYTFTAVEDDR